MTSVKRTALLCIALMTGSTSAWAAYTRTESAPVQIQSIYANEMGSPFVFFMSSVNAACSSNGMYLYDITVSEGDAERRRNKMAIALSAQLAGKLVVLDYFYDPGITGWAACYIQGIRVID